MEPSKTKSLPRSGEAEPRKLAKSRQRRSKDDEDEDYYSQLAQRNWKRKKKAWKTNRYKSPNKYIKPWRSTSNVLRDISKDFYALENRESKAVADPIAYRVQGVNRDLDCESHKLKHRLINDYD